MKQHYRRALLALSLTTLLLTGMGNHRLRAAQAAARFFPETGYSIQGRFLTYWETHGGLSQFGFPLTDELPERSDQDGQTRTVQYFERAVFEHHPEYTGTPYEVLLSRLGASRYLEYYGPDGAPEQHAGIDNPRIFPATGKTLGGPFRAYWDEHGGLAQFGYPISDEFTEISPLDNRPYTVQYFERAIFERHPEYTGTPYQVLIAQAGTYQHRARYGMLNIPPPSDERFARYFPVASGSFLVWGERRGYGVNAILALDLQTGQSQTVAGNISAWDTWPYHALSSPYVTWLDELGTVVSKDLVAGTVVTITERGADPDSGVAIAGNTIVWANRDRQLVTTDLATGTTSMIPSTTSPIGPYIGHLAISKQYVAWTELGRGPPDNRPYRVRAFNRTTHQGSEVAQGVYGDATDHQPPWLALSEHHLFWTAGPLFLTDLDTGQTTTLYSGPAVVPVIRGDTLIWSAPGPITEGPFEDRDIWGMRLSRRIPMPLVAGPGWQGRAAIAEDWLIWEDYSGPLGAKRLIDAFAAAPPR